MSEEAREFDPELVKSVTTALSNPAVARCDLAWERIYDLVSTSSNDPNDAPSEPNEDQEEEGDNDDDFFARQRAALAFRLAMPPLSGYQNIQDFIACVTYARLQKIIDREDASELLHAAQVALSAIRAQPRQPKS